METEQDGYRRTLELAFGFDAQDLAQNQAGQLTPHQAELVTRWRQEMLRERGTVVAVMLVFTLLGVYCMVTDRCALLVLVGFVSAIGLLISGTVMVVRDLRYRRALKAGAVEHRCGPIMKELLETRYGEMRLMTIDDVEFTLSERQYTVLTDGGRYCVYFVPVMQRIVAIIPQPTEAEAS